MAVALRTRVPVRVVRPGVSLHLGLVAACLVVAGLLPATAVAQPQPEPGRVVVAGAGNRSAVVDIPQDIGVRAPGPALSGGGDYAAVVVERLEGARYELVFTAALVRAFQDETAESQGFFGAGTFSAGRYRLTLLGDGPVRAEWQMTGAERPGLLVTPRTPVAARFLGRAEPLGPELSGARVDLPQAVPAGRRVLQLILLTGTRADDVVMCATTADDCPRQDLPACPPAPVPCSTGLRLPTWVSTGETSVGLVYGGPATQVRALRWDVEGYREVPDRLRAAAIVF